MPSAVTAKRLVKRYGAQTAVDGVDFDVREGECFGFLGPNGAGKTTTMKMVYCILPRTSGELSVLGMDPDGRPEAIKESLGVVPQDNNLDGDLDVWANLVVYARYYGIPRVRAASRAAELLEFVQLAEKRHAEIESLSSGMLRRLLIARGLINDPRLMILDEPTVGLDPQARHLLWDRLHELKGRNVTLLITTHYMEEATELCDRVAIMDHGKILVTGAPRDLIRAEIGEEVVELVLDGREHAGVEAVLAGFPVTLEKTTHKLYIYCRDCTPPVDALMERGYRHILRRPTVLEDVFLKLTGRDLVD
ncbi:MAG: ABC transporter ATP-binding protein [Chlamydiota bacterium]